MFDFEMWIRIEFWIFQSWSRSIVTSYPLFGGERGEMKGKCNFGFGLLCSVQFFLMIKNERKNSCWLFNIFLDFRYLKYFD